MDKRFWGIIAGIAIIFIGIVVINNRQADAPQGNAQATSHYKGENARDITLVEYGDYQCPTCYSYHPVVEQVVEKYNADIRFQFRHFPLQQIHQNAFAASRAAEAAGKQNKFWEMHDLLYVNQDPNGQQGWATSRDPLNAFFATYAQQIGINVDQFKTDYVSDPVNDAVNADIAAGNALNVTGTPSFFLNGKKIELTELTGQDGRPSLERFSAILDKAIEEKGGPSASSSSDSDAAGSTQEAGTTSGPGTASDTPASE